MSTIPSDRMLKLMSPADRKSLGKAGLTSDEAQAKIDAKNERELQNQISDYLRMKDILFFQAPFGRKSRMREGMPDFSFSYRGKACYIEAKAKGNELSQGQREVIDKLLNEPNLANVCVAYKLDSVKTFLEMLEK